MRMAFLQRAWLFEPSAFHTELAGILGPRAFDAAALRVVAVERATHDEADREYLRMLAVDTAALTEASSLGELYAACMATRLKAVPSISDPGWLLAFLKDDLGCGPETYDPLIYGNPLRTALDGIANDRLASAVRGDLTRAYGGWLSPNAARELRASLEDLEQAFVDPSESFALQFAAAFRCDTQDAGSRTQKWYHESIDLLGRVTDADAVGLRIIAS
jgi:hypothetical protein